MKILMIAPTPFFAHRGCHVRILEEIRALTARGHEIALCTYGLGEEVSGVRTVRTVRVPWYRKLTAGPSWHKLYLDVLLLGTALRSARRFHPDVIHAHLHEGAFLGAIVSRISGVPLLADFQGSMTTEMADHGFFSGWAWGEKMFVRLEGWINSAPREIVVSSSQSIPPITASRPGRSETVSFLLDGVDAEAFRPDSQRRAEARTRLRLGADEKVVGYLGLLTEYQGVDLLLEAARTVVERRPGTRFLVMGFPNEERYRQRAVALGLGRNVIFTGRVAYDDAPALLAAVDVAVSAKVSVTEANGKLLNYMAVGLPTVVFETPVNRELLGDLGVYARFGEREDLAAKLIELLDDDTRRRRIGESLRARVLEKFSWDGRARRFEEIYAMLRSTNASPDTRRSRVA
jgi:glycosyltransferase involved in cell wall biosynthesis